MDKYESRAKALLSGLESLLRTIKERMERGIWSLEPKPDSENDAPYRDMLLDIQLLFYCYDPQIPLYAEALALNKRIEDIKNNEEDYARYEDFQELKYVLGKFLDVLAFRQQP